MKKFKSSFNQVKEGIRSEALRMIEEAEREECHFSTKSKIVIAVFFLSPLVLQILFIEMGVAAEPGAEYWLFFPNVVMLMYFVLRRMLKKRKKISLKEK